MTGESAGQVALITGAGSGPLARDLAGSGGRGHHGSGPSRPEHPGRVGAVKDGAGGLMRTLARELAPDVDAGLVSR
jgi:NAD(P)-dependent dehydrogenase (short-subunit alcohol dehydrogenase family)